MVGVTALVWLGGTPPNVTAVMKAVDPTPLFVRFRYPKSYPRSSAFLSQVEIPWPASSRVKAWAKNQRSPRTANY